MPVRESAPTGSPCWLDLWTSDTDASRSFYRELFGWEAQEPSPEFGGYFMFTRDGIPTAGCMGDMGDAPANDSWKVYLASDDAAKTAETAEAAGAQVVVTPMPVADLGVQAVLVDPAGATVGVWEPKSFPGLTVLNEHGTPSWFELHTREHAISVAFYRSVFGWEVNNAADSDEFRYTTMHDPIGDRELAGIMDASGFLAEGRRHCGRSTSRSMTQMTRSPRSVLSEAQSRWKLKTPSTDAWPPFWTRQAPSSNCVCPTAREG